MKLIDTHSHLFLEQFDKDRDLVVKKAIDSNINKIVLPNISSTTIDSLLELSDKYPNNCFPLIGLHPTSVKANYLNELEIVEKYLEKRKFIGVGEIGIDLYWDKTHLKEQIDAFVKQINLAKKYKLPIVIHARDSFDEVFEVIDNMIDDNLYGIFHAFTGGIKQAEKIISYKNFKIGIGGVVTFKNSGLDKIVNKIDLNHIVLETDSPFLTPSPFRGKRNESSYINIIAKKIADIKNVDISHIAEITTKNAHEIFKFN